MADSAPNTTFNKEAYFLQCLASVVQGIGDDCVILDIDSRICTKKHTHSRHIAHIKAPKLNSLVIGADSFCEGVHFLAHWFKPSDLAYKAFLVNYSDFVAMNAKPLFATLSVALPKIWQKREIKDFVNGIAKFCQAYHIRLIGGDTITAKDCQIHITMLGKPQRHTIYRDNIKPQSDVYITSDRYPKNAITKGIKDLRHLLRTKLDSRICKAKARFLAPRIRDTFIAQSARFIKGGLDISDGIVAEITRLCALNKLSFKPSVDMFATHFRALGSESYEMLLVIQPKDSRRLGILANKHRIKLQKLGTFTRKKHFLRTMPAPHIWH